MIDKGVLNGSGSCRTTVRGRRVSCAAKGWRLKRIIERILKWTNLKSAFTRLLLYMP